MIYQFDTEDRHAATGALLVYAIYRSRDRRRYKVTPDMWSQIERFVKAAAKRAESLMRFVEALKPRFACGTIHPRWMEVGVTGAIPLARSGHGELIQLANQPDQREFLTGVLDHADHARVLDALYHETAWVVLLVRDRLERERPIEQRFEVALSDEEVHA